MLAHTHTFALGFGLAIITRGLVEMLQATQLAVFLEVYKSCGQDAAEFL